MSYPELWLDFRQMRMKRQGRLKRYLGDSSGLGAFRMRRKDGDRERSQTSMTIISHSQYVDPSLNEIKTQDDMEEGY